jgi:hypothetical protein
MIDPTQIFTYVHSNHFYISLVAYIVIIILIIVILANEKSGAGVYTALVSAMIAGFIGLGATYIGMGSGVAPSFSNPFARSVPA